ncbi:MAG: DUF58 domain-containing protein [Vicinamibacteria bacterium]
MAGLRDDLVVRLRRTILIGGVIRAWETRLTPRGRFVLSALLLFGFAGADTRKSQVHLLFAGAAGLFLASVIFAARFRPRVQVECLLPGRATAGTPVPFTTRVTPMRRAGGELVVEMPVSPDARGLLHAEPPRAFMNVRDEPVEVTVQLHPERRGRYRLRGARVRRTDPLRLMSTTSVTSPDATLLVYPRFWRLDHFDVPIGRSYQPGGIPLASSTGDAIEFVGTRDYREGDPIKNIHWRSWARRGQPVVKEYQEEYFSRVALIMDTYLPKSFTEAHRQAFEGAVSVVASIADWFSRGEAIVDVLAAGPDLYEVSAGRSLGYLDNILDVLACLEPCSDPPFGTVGPHLHEKLARLTSVVVVMLDWDDAREQFLRGVREQGTGLRCIIVREDETTKPWAAAAGDLGSFTQMTPLEVERALKAESV